MSDCRAFISGVSQHLQPGEIALDGNGDAYIGGLVQGRFPFPAHVDVLWKDNFKDPATDGVELD